MQFLKTMKQRLMARWAALAFVFLVVFGTAGDKLLGFRKVAPGFWVTILGTVGALFLLMQKTTYLPFLGETILPPSVLKLAAPTEATFDVTVKVPGRATHVIYWAAGPATTIIPNPTDAYAGFTNAGVVPVINGTATLPVMCPAAYKVPMKSTPLDKHVHYRAVFPEGILGDVNTENILC
jgi:hypothetical protein